jgi:hypothetical protein
VPRFETSIEVQGKSPQEILKQQFKGLDLECGPTGGGAPTEVETREFRPHQAPSLDFVALARAFAEKFKGKGPDRYYLYRIHRRGGLSYTLRDEPMPASELYGAEGASFELVDSFSDIDSARRGWERLERGFETTARADPGSPVPLWATSPCRPRKQ